MAVETNRTASLYPLQIDETYEFSAPRFFDFAKEESEEELQKAELWFETALSYAPSPFMPKIKTSRFVQLDSLCNFGDAEEGIKNEPMKTECNAKDEATLAPQETRNPSNLIPTETRKEETHDREQEKRASPFKQIFVAELSEVEMKNQSHRIASSEAPVLSSSKVAVLQEARTPKAGTISTKPKGEQLLTSSKKIKPSPSLKASAIRNSSALKPHNQTPLLQTKKGVKPTSVARYTGSIAAKKKTIATDFAQENQAIKRQKLEDGKSRQILNVKNRILHHKSKPGFTSSANFSASTIKGRRDERNDELSRRKAYVREPVAPYVSTAEMVKIFESKPREMDLSHRRSLSHDDSTSMIQRKPRLTLTRPKEPDFETAHRVRLVKLKSSAELEEEMLANVPKFRARPVNKKVLEAPSLPALPRSTPQLPRFQEFHLKTMERANQNPTTSSATDSSSHNQGKLHRLTEPKPPLLETSLRVRPSKVKSSQEIEQEELEKIPKFKARPLNKKIFESRGDLGLFCNPKRQITTPVEFHFATNERIPPPPPAVADLFDKLSLKSEPRDAQQQIPKNTTPNPFHLHTEERGLEKERRFALEVLQKQLEEERARVPKAAPYPYSTDYPVIPPKPEVKEPTKPEAFQLESLVRHEEEMRRKMEEKGRMEKEEAQMRIFKAQPIMKDDPLPVPEKARKPLTEIQEFILHVDYRAVDRAEFDSKIKEKEITYKRYREEAESAKMVEEEKAVKQMRKTMVPHIRPIPKFDNPFLPQRSSKETTKPKSPNLRVVQRKERRRLVGVLSAASGVTAAHMR